MLKDTLDLLIWLGLIGLGVKTLLNGLGLAFYVVVMVFAAVVKLWAVTFGSGDATCA